MGGIALINTLASLDRQSEQTRFTEFKSTFRQTFSVPPTETFVNFEKNYPKDYFFLTILLKYPPNTDGQT